MGFMYMWTQIPQWQKKIIRPMVNLYRGIKDRRNLERVINSYPVSDLNSEEKILFQNLAKKKRLTVYPFAFEEDYLQKQIDVYYDDDCRMCYVLHNEKRLYFRRNLNKLESVGCYRQLLIEQDCRSPHCYVTEEHQVESNCILLDLGAAEGIFALEHVETAKEIYLFECDESWISALEETFKPWRSKVHIIKKYVSDVVDETRVTLDSIFTGTNVRFFIKADVEAAENDVIIGAERLLQSNEVKMSICTYHTPNDAETIKRRLDDLNFKGDYSDGYMFFYHDRTFPYFRKGLYRAANYEHM